MKTELQILYEDNHVIGVIKPPGLLSQPGRTHAGRLGHAFRRERLFAR